MTTNDNGHALLMCPACHTASTFTLTLATTISYPFVRSDGLDLFGDTKEPEVGDQASFDDAYCNSCLVEVDEETLHALAAAAR